MDAKFKIGDKVQVTAEPEDRREVCEVVGITISADAVMYKITSTEVDVAGRKLIEGHKTVAQEEIELAAEDKKSK